MPGSFKTSNVPRFSCSYPEVLEACRRKNITMLLTLWERTNAAFQYSQTQRVLNGFNLEDVRGVSLSNLYCMLNAHLEKKVTPWDFGKKKWRPLARCVGVALGNVSLQTLFGSPEELEQTVKRPGSMPTPQRLHIQSLMRKAFNPLTGKRGITPRELMAMASTKSSAINRLSAILDAGTSDSADNEYMPFNRATGAATDWALDLAAILGHTVEEVFPYSVSKLTEDNTQACLPLDKNVGLEHCGDVPETRDSLSLSLNSEQEELFNLLDTILQYPEKPFTSWDVKILRLRFFDGLTFEQAGLELGTTNQGNPISKQRAEQIEKKAREKLKRRLQSYGIKSLSDAGLKFD